MAYTFLGRLRIDAERCYSNERVRRTSLGRYKRIRFHSATDWEYKEKRKACAVIFVAISSETLFE